VAAITLSYSVLIKKFGLLKWPIYINMHDNIIEQVASIKSSFITGDSNVKHTNIATIYNQ
jgi:hypothetical protein